MAFLFALEKFPKAKFIIVSIGAGLPNDTVDERTAVTAGELAWLGPILHIMLNGLATDTSRSMRDISKKITLTRVDYFRFSLEVPTGNSSISDSSPENIEALKDLGKALVERERENLRHVSDLLMSKR